MEDGPAHMVCHLPICIDTQHHGQHIHGFPPISSEDASCLYDPDLFDDVGDHAENNQSIWAMAI